MNIPKLYPDEYIIGWRGRIRFFNHLPSSAHTINELREFYDRNNNDISLKKRGTSKIYILSKFSRMPLEDFLQQHTLFPFSHPFDNISEKEKSKETFQKYLSSSSQRLHKQGAWFCTSCISQDEKEHGISYWRRSHQLLGIDWCFKHRFKLRRTTEAAFDFEPKLATLHTDVLIPPGPESLDEAESVIQRYAEISEWLLTWPNTLKLEEISSLIEFKFLAQQYIENEKTGRNLYDRFKEEIPEFWEDQFTELNTRTTSFDIFDFRKLFVHNRAAQDTEHYIIALSLLFNSSATAIAQIQRPNDRELRSEAPLRGGIPNPWWGQQILNQYSDSKGCHSTFAGTHGMDFDVVTATLKQHGLPDFRSVERATMRALVDFFNGQPLNDVCVNHGANISDVEEILRLASCRLFSALKKISEVVN
ncbi:TniQ family protein [Chitinibacter sp. S2-10]|uniref:TniQ family protein n=1 Tax=Chitinibacter sp. S2-10 TaxID=3373597 RepID=UPI00397761DA